MQFLWFYYQKVLFKKKKNAFLASNFAATCRAGGKPVKEDYLKGDYLQKHFPKSVFIANLSLNLRGYDQETR